MKKKFFFAYILEIPNFLSLFIFAFFMSATSPILIEVSKTLGASPERMNLIITFFMVGVTIGIISNIFLALRFKNKHIVLGCYILLIPVLIGLVLAGSLAVFYTLYLLAGFLLGIIWINANNNMVEGQVKNKDSVVNIGHVFFALAALTSPIISSNLITTEAGWKYLYYIVIFLAVISVVLYLVFEKWRSGPVQIVRERISLRSIFDDRGKNIFMVISILILVFYFILETVIFSWFPTFLRLGRSFDVFQAGYTLSFFWIGILAGRLIISVLSYRIKADHILFGLSVLSIISLSIAIFSRVPVLNYTGIGLAGLGFSGFVPLMISSSSEIFKQRKDIVLTIILAIGISSNALGPVIASFIAGYNLTMSVAVSIIFMSGALIFLVIRYFYRKNINTQ
jgi:FHS family glucose/mannose:H+ symporter-like MFS transporter